MSQPVGGNSGRITDVTDPAEFQQLYTGRLWSVLGWDQLTAFWQHIDPAAGWYVHAFGLAHPRSGLSGTHGVAAPALGVTPASPERIVAFIAAIDALLRAEHRESYCGIVYADDLENPRLIKIFDPNNLGSSCGSSKHPPGPGWIMSRLPPEGLGVEKPAPAGRQRWWRELFPDS